MISIRKYIDGAQEADASCNSKAHKPGPGANLAEAAIGGYCAALHAMGRYGSDACPAEGRELTNGLGKLADDLAHAQSVEAVAAAGEGIRGRLREWGRRTARHYQAKAREVKDILLMMAGTAESVGERDQRCALQINAVTVQLKGIANLEDLTEIRASIEKSAAELKTSIDRMTAEGKAALEQLRREVSTYQAKVEEAEQLATRDALTRLGNRLWVEGQIEKRIAAAAPFCTAILDIDDFKQVNDQHGHLVGDELLRQFSYELRSACRSTDVIGRWGGDEFLVVLDCGLSEAEEQIARVTRWVCGNYTVVERGGQIRLHVGASIGLAAHTPGETLKELLDRADREMYRSKSAVRSVRRTGGG